MKERMLFMGAPGTGKTLQVVNIASFIEEEYGLPMYYIDLEDKASAMLENMKGGPSNIELRVAFDWDNENTGGLKQHVDWLESVVKPGDWVCVDRMDLAWAYVQRWFTELKYKETMADRLASTSVNMKKGSMFIPRFDGGAWQVINEQYEWMMLRILFRMRANVIMTSGIKAGDEGSSPLDVYGNLGVIPRGQKELGHQPHSVFLFTQRRVNSKMAWRVSTGKDLPNRVWFDNEPLTDFSVMYVEKYFKPVK